MMANRLEKIMAKQFVSIIIPMYNSEEFIQNCLERIFSLDYPRERYEVIVVDNGSTDNGVALTKKFPVKIVPCPEGNISKVRNTGAKAAKGKLFAFVDTDCALDAKWLATGEKILMDQGTAAAGGGYRPPPQSSWIPKAWYIETRAEVRKVRFLPAGNFLVKAEAFNGVGGFDESLVTCEDSDICERMVKKGYDIFLSSKMICIHLKNPESLLEFFKKEVWYSLGMLSTIKNGFFDKVLILTVFFYLSHISILFVGLSGVFFVLLIVTAAAFHRVSYSKKYIYYGHILVLYYFYFWARGIGLVKSLVLR